MSNYSNARLWGGEQEQAQLSEFEQVFVKLLADALVAEYRRELAEGILAKDR
jgi:hypothetical protein